MENNELQHWGVKGMRWGFRRYQNKDGSLTAAGKKRYDKEKTKLEEREKVLKRKMRTQAKFDKLDAKRKQLDEMENQISPKKKKGNSVTPDTNKQQESTKQNAPAGKTSTFNKPLHQMTDLEIQALSTRYKNIKSINEYLKEANPKKESVGKKFIKKMFDDAIIPAATEYGKAQMLKWLNSHGKARKVPPSSSKQSSASDSGTAKAYKPSGIFTKFTSKGKSAKSSKGRTVFEGTWRDVTVNDITRNAGVYMELGRSVVTGLLPERTRDD